MGELPFQADDVDEQALGEAVFAHHPGRGRAARGGELDAAVFGDSEQPVALHPAVVCEAVGTL
jgi:hypothetical protein